MKNKNIKAPKWLRDRMKKLRGMPKPTWEESLAQWKALGEARNKN